MFALFVAACGETVKFAGDVLNLAQSFQLVLSELLNRHETGRVFSFCRRGAENVAFAALAALQAETGRRRNQFLGKVRRNDRRCGERRRRKQRDLAWVELALCWVCLVLETIYWTLRESQQE